MKLVDIEFWRPMDILPKRPATARIEAWSGNHAIAVHLTWVEFQDFLAQCRHVEQAFVDWSGQEPNLKSRQGDNRQ